MLQLMNMGIFTRKTPQSPLKKQGKFIVIDGSNQHQVTECVEMILKTLKVSGYDTEVISFPVMEAESSGILKKYQSIKFDGLKPEAISLLYAINRLEVMFHIRDLISQNKIVIANRYIASSAINQGSKIEDSPDRIKFYKWLDTTEYKILNNLKPDLNIILHSPNSETNDQVYYEIAELFPNTRLIECNKNNEVIPKNIVHANVWEIIRRIALKDVTPNF